MTDPLASAIEQYGKFDRRFLPGACYYLSDETAAYLRRRCATYIDGPVRPSAIMGIPVIIDDSLPCGVIELRKRETQLEKMIREARASGVTINVTSPVFEAPELFPMPPKPTLRALLRHWAKKWRK